MTQPLCFHCNQTEESPQHQLSEEELQYKPHQFKPVITLEVVWDQLNKKMKMMEEKK